MMKVIDPLPLQAPSRGSRREPSLCPDPESNPDLRFPGPHSAAQPPLLGCSLISVTNTGGSLVWGQIQENKQKQ